MPDQELTDAEFLRQTFGELQEVVRSVRDYSGSHAHVGGQYVERRMRDIERLLDKLRTPRSKQR